MRQKSQRNDSLLSSEQLKAVHVLYQRGYSVRQLARAYWDMWGYKTAGAAARSIYHGFHAENLHLRDGHHAADVRDRDKPRQAQLFADEPWLGEGYCAGRVTNYPRVGGPCRRRVRPGQRYCAKHDPARASDVKKQAAKARAA